MNSKLISKAAGRIVAASDFYKVNMPACAAEAIALEILDIVLKDVLLPEYERWRDVDGEIGIVASGTLANVIAKLTVGFPERPA
jgi:hypothetical protein